MIRVNCRCRDKPEAGFRIILEAINSKNISDLIDLAEKKFTLTDQQRDMLIEKIETEKCGQAAEEWLKKKEREPQPFTPKQLDRLEQIGDSGYMDFFQKMIAKIGLIEKQGEYWFFNDLRVEQAWSRFFGFANQDESC